MILSASRRTDIPAFFGEWFINRLRAGEVLVRNPLNPGQVSSIDLSRNSIDCIVFWTKNPGPFLKHLDEIDSMGYPYYFTITLNPYDRTIERNVDRKRNIIGAVDRLSRRIGKKRIIWRYDPIIFSRSMDMDYHLKWFDYLASGMKAHTEKCVFSFLEEYRKIRKNLDNSLIRLPGAGEKRELVSQLAEIAGKYGLALSSCAQSPGFGDLGIEANRCVDPFLIGEISGHPVKGDKDRSQRAACGCAVSRDIGSYNTCLHDCLYCYANIDKKSAAIRAGAYDPLSPLLCDSLMGNETISSRRGSSPARQNGQRELFE